MSAATALRVSAIVLSVVVSAAAQAAVQGSCTYKGSKHALVDGAVWQLPADPDEASDDADQEDEPVQPKLMLAFASFALDIGKLQHADDREDELQDQAFAHDGSTKLDLTLQVGEGVSQQYLWISPGTNLSNSGSEIGEYKAKGAPAGRMAGHYHYADDDADGPVCDVEFEVPILDDKAHAPAK
jgi:hypothetical protein